ncbi:MAG: EF-P lysine aminoacylase EpmA [Pseudomonadota bacterium]|nr:EF-P lysine aminoacylase EpmA [Pseudomonadota bacterium]
MHADDWLPTASPELLQARAHLNRTLRAFFDARGVLEVETPLLSHAIGTDPNLHPVTANYQPHPHAPAQTLYLQTSPEFAMKRLLAAGSGPIYQLCKAVRNGESGTRHNPEFTMLEWYRPGFTLAQLMDEVEALVVAVLGPRAFTRLTYRELFQQQLGIDPHAIGDAELQALVAKHIDLHQPETHRDTLLELLYNQVVEPALQEAVFIHEYPATQAALARITQDARGRAVALRFELVIGGMEIANGYDELADAAEQQKRFNADQALRRARGLPEFPVDARLLAALQHGMPACAGVALGVDRLLMLQCGARDISGVLNFPHSRA